MGKYTDEWIGGETDLEVAENEYKLLSEKKEQYLERLAKKIAREILHKKVKVLSPEVRQIRNEMRELLKER